MVLKKYLVLGTVRSGKPPKSEPYRAVPCSGKAPLEELVQLLDAAGQNALNNTAVEVAENLR